MWSKKDLQKLIKEKMGDYLFIAVSTVSLTCIS
jgi:hypothetical protein